MIMSMDNHAPTLRTPCTVNYGVDFGVVALPADQPTFSITFTGTARADLLWFHACVAADHD